MRRRDARDGTAGERSLSFIAVRARSRRGPPAARSRRRGYVRSRSRGTEALRSHASLISLIVILGESCSWVSDLRSARCRRNARREPGRPPRESRPRPTLTGTLTALTLTHRVSHSQTLSLTHVTPWSHPSSEVGSPRPSRRECSSISFCDFVVYIGQGRCANHTHWAYTV